LACGSFWDKAGKEIRATNSINKYLIFSIRLILNFLLKVIRWTKIVNCYLMNNPMEKGLLNSAYLNEVV
jgi:hypothetical protein